MVRCPMGYGLIKPDEVQLICWSIYVPSNAQKWPA